MRLAVGRCSLLRKLCKALFCCKTLKKVTELRVVKFLVPFFFFFQKSALSGQYQTLT